LDNQKKKKKKIIIIDDDSFILTSIQKQLNKENDEKNQEEEKEIEDESRNHTGLHNGDQGSIEKISLDDLKKKLRKDDYKILLVFMNPFNISDINDWEKSIPMPFAKYIAQDIFSDEEKYITNNSKKTDPLTIVLNERKEVVFLEEPGMKNEVVMQNIKKVIGGS